MSEESRTTTQRGKVIVGVTGNIATGKSAVMRLAAENGALTIDADHVVHELMDSDAALQAAIAVAFGPEVRLSDGRINRRALGKIVFNDTTALQDLEQIVHPSVRLAIGQKIQDTEKKFIFLEAIKLLEGPLRDICHRIWVTRCPRQRQLERLTICRGMDAQTATHRVEMQHPQEDKVAQADVVIDTAGLMRETEMQFEMAWSRLPAPDEVDPITLTVPAGAAAAPLPETAVAEKEPPPKKKTLLDRPIPSSLKAKLGKKLHKPSQKAAALSPEPETQPAPAAAETAADPQPAAPAPPPAAFPAAAQAPEPATDVEVRRARPSDIPSILLLIHRATAGAVKLKRADMLMALGERSYFIGQVGTDIHSVIGWNIENLVSRIDQFYFHPADTVSTVGPVMLESIENSADQHICEIMVAFLPLDAPAPLNQLFANHGFHESDLDKMPVSWRSAIRESQPENTRFVIKVLRERVTHPM